MTTKSIIRLSLLIAAFSTAQMSNAQSKYSVGYMTPFHTNNGSSIFDNDADTTKFPEAIYQALLSGTIKAFDPQKEKETLLSTSEVRKIFSPLLDTVTMIDPVTMKETIKIVKSERKISSIKCNEEWSIDKTGHLSKVVKSYILCTKSFDAKGNYRGDQYLVKIKNDSK
jgi:hypothetical protein